MSILFFVVGDEHSGGLYVIEWNGDVAVNGTFIYTPESYVYNYDEYIDFKRTVMNAQLLYTRIFIHI